MVIKKKVHIQRAAAQRKREKDKKKDQTSRSPGRAVRKLADELAHHHLKIKEVKADGNCFFRAVADQLEGPNGDHMQLRSKTVSFMRQHREDFEPYMENDEEFDLYCKRMAEDGTWAGQQEQVAVARLAGILIHIFQDRQPLWTIKPNYPEFPQDAPGVYLSYHDSEHYNSVRAADDPGTGPPAPISLALRPPAGMDRAAARSWGVAEEEAVAQGTGRYDDREAVRRALADARGDPDQAIEILIERLAAEEAECGEAGLGSAQEEEGQALAGGSSSPAAAAEAPAASTPECSDAGGQGQPAVERPRDRQDSLSDQQIDSEPASAASAVENAPACKSGLAADRQSAEAPLSHQEQEHAAGPEAGGLQGEPAQEQAAKSVGHRKTLPKKPARNRECPCGSSKRYKNCCGPLQAAAARRAQTASMPDSDTTHAMAALLV